MQPNATDNGGFACTGKRPQAVELVAADILSDAEIARKLGVNKVTLERWKKNPEFADAVALARQELAEAIRRKGIALKQNRLDAYVHRHNLLEQIRTERAAEFAEKWPNVAGGGTGLMLRDIKLVKVVKEDDRPDYREYDVFGEDSTMLTEFRHLEKQIAYELGEWQESLNVSGSLTREYVIVREGSDSPAEDVG